MGISAEDIAGAKATMNDFMPDRFTNARTGIILPCRVAAQPTLERSSGLPPEIRVPRWRLRVPDGSDLVAADSGTIPSRGTYVVLWTEDEATYSTEVVAHAVRMRDQNGNPPTFLPTPVEVWSFSSNNPHTQTHAFLYDAKADLQVFPEAAGFTWAAVLDKTLGIKANWKIQWTDRDGIQQTGTIKTIREPGGALPLIVGYVVIDKG